MSLQSGDIVEYLPKTKPDQSAGFFNFRLLDRDEDDKIRR